MKEYPDFVESTGYGVDPLGLCGINCYHSFDVFFPEFQTPTYTEEELEELQRGEEATKEYEGKEYTGYQATQAMRKMERTMRKHREKIVALKQAQADADAIKEEKAKYHAVSARYSAFAKAMELPEHRDRVTMDGLGRVT